mgnify:CR=1 FL=1
MKVDKNYYVSVKDFLVVGVGESMQDAKLDYEKALRQNPSSSTITDSTNTAELEGTVYRINQEIIAGDTVYRFILNERKDIVLEAQGSVSEMLSLTREGDSVKLVYRETQSPIKELVSFENTGFALVAQHTGDIIEADPQSEEAA